MCEIILMLQCSNCVKIPASSPTHSESVLVCEREPKTHIANPQLHPPNPKHAATTYPSRRNIYFGLMHHVMQVPCLSCVTSGREIPGFHLRDVGSNPRHKIQRSLAEAETGSLKLTPPLCQKSTSSHSACRMSTQPNHDSRPQRSD